MNRQPRTSDTTSPAMSLDENPPELLFESRFGRLLRRGRWEFVQRTRASGAVIIVAVTAENCVLLVEQFREPVNCRVIEFPAGIAGDEPGGEDEPLLTAARRELLEETGYEADEWHTAFTGASSAGLTDERATFFIARGLRKVQPGGGVESEEITDRKSVV